MKKGYRYLEHTKGAWGYPDRFGAYIRAGAKPHPYHMMYAHLLRGYHYSTDRKYQNK